MTSKIFARTTGLAAAALLIGLPAAAQTGVGAPFGARDPKTCASTAAPAHGAPSAEQARLYVMCGFEHAKGSGSLGELYLTDAVTVQVGKGRPFEYGDGQGDIDVKAAVIPIRGAMTYYRCYPISSGHPNGQSCKKTEWPKAEGECYRTSFGDWRCYMTDTVSAKADTGYFGAPR